MLKRLLTFLPGIVISIAISVIFVNNTAQQILLSIILSTLVTLIVVGYYELKKLESDIETAYLAIAELSKNTHDNFANMNDVWDQDLQQITENFSEETHQLAIWVAELRYGSNGEEE